MWIARHHPVYKELVYVTKSDTIVGEVVASNKFVGTLRRVLKQKGFLKVSCKGEPELYEKF